MAAPRFAPFRAVAVDLDGTLLGSNQSISRENRAAIAGLHAAGVEVVLASGRHRNAMLPVALRLPEVRWMVTAQGALVCDVQGEAVLYENPMPADRAEEAVRIGLGHGFPTLVYATTGIYTLHDSPWIERYVEIAGYRPTKATVEVALEQTILKVMVIDHPDRIQAALGLPEVESWDLYKTRSLDCVLELAGVGTHKGHGLSALVDHLGIGLEEVAAFGDAPNDLPMLERVGFGVAMDGGWDAVKRAAHAVTPPGPAATAFARGVRLLEDRARALRAGVG